MAPRARFACGAPAAGTIVEDHFDGVPGRHPAAGKAVQKVMPLGSLMPVQWDQRADGLEIEWSHGVAIQDASAAVFKVSFAKTWKVELQELQWDLSRELRIGIH